MEGTQPNASTKRKRRSSILKSQRAPRTPFSELEFNVATPTDTAKSRRVSFSRRTGVAEFATNEATTTWKNVYEEQNRSLETSGQDSSGGRPSVGHLGNRIFDQQFEEVEAEIDFSPLEGPAAGPFNQSLHIAVTEQLALLETTADGRKLTAPSTQFELTEFTDHGKIFKDDLTNPTNNEMSNIQINFSTLQSLSNHDNDDLDAIERDLENSHPYVVCPGPYTNRGDVSQYIEFDLNTTQIAEPANESDMSITDTIRSPKKEVSNVDIPVPISSWVENKENIVVNPYVAPDEANNFAIHKSPEKVLVFDGKKLKYAAIDDDLNDLEVPEDKRANKSAVNKSLDTNQIKKVMYADLNSEESSKTQLNINSESNTTLIYADGDMSADISMTGLVNVAQMKRQTKIFSLDDGDMSTTKCVSNTAEVDQEVDMIVTQVLTNMLKESFENVSKSNKYEQEVLANMVETEAKSFQDFEKPETKRQTIVFKENEGEISLTTCVPNEVLPKLGDKTEASFNMSITKVVSSDLLRCLSRVNSEVDEVEISSVDMSMTKVVPNNLIATLKPEELESSGNMSMTKAVSNQIIAELAADNKKTHEVDVSTANMSMTRAVPYNIIANFSPKDTKLEEMEISDINMSMTKAVSNKIIDNLITEHQNPESENIAPDFETPTMTSVAMDISDVNMSMTKAVPHIVLANMAVDYQIPERGNAKPDLEASDVNMSMTKAVPNNILSNLATQKYDFQETEPLVGTYGRRKTIVFLDADVSMTEAIPTNLIEEAKEKSLLNQTSIPSPPTSEHVSFVQSNRQAVDVIEKSYHRRSVLTEETPTVNRSICFEDVSNQTLAVSSNIAKILSKQTSPDLLRSKSPKLNETRYRSPKARLSRSKSPETRQKSPLTSPNKSFSRTSRLSAGKRANSARSTSPDRDNKLLSLEKFSEKKRRSRSPDTHNNMARYTAARKSRLSSGKAGVNPFSYPSKATSPERTPTSAKKTVKPYQILNKATSPENKDWDLSGINKSNREVFVYQAVSPNPKKPSETSTLCDTTTNPSSAESTTTSSDKLESKTTTNTSDTPEEPVGRTLHFYNQTAVLQETDAYDENYRRQNVPTSKGDEFQKSSQKLYGSKPVIDKLENPQQERRRTSPSKAESKFEEPIKTIAYDQLDSLSKKSIKTPLAQAEHGCQPETDSTTPELVSEATSFNTSQIHSLSKDESLTAVANTKETSCDPMPQEFAVETPRTVVSEPVFFSEDIGLDPPSEPLTSFANHSIVQGITTTATGTQRSPSPSFRSDAESAKTTLTAPKSSSSNESCKTLTDSTEITSEEEPHKPSDTSTKTLLNNLLDMSDISFPTNCGEAAQASLKTQIVAENFNKTVCGVTGSPHMHQNTSFATKNKRQSAKPSPAKSFAATDVKKKITFSDSPEQVTYEPPTDTDTYDSNEGEASAIKRSPIFSKYFERNQPADDSDTSTVTDDKPSKLLDIISVLTRPDPDALTSTTSSEGQPGSAKNHMFNLMTDTEDTSQVSIVQDGKLIRVHDSDSTDTDMTTLRKPAYSTSDYSNHKGNVIPSQYYDDVAENVNDLMKDLIKPRSDGYPFEDVPFPKIDNKSPSICSTQVQATLATSSQVDLETLPCDSMYELSNVCQENARLAKPLKGIIKQSPSGELTSGPEDEYDSVTLKLQKHRCETNDERILVFDQNNPLNNVMIAPIDFAEAHQYNPESDIETSETEENQMAVNSVQIQPRSPSIQSEIDGQAPHNKSMKDALKDATIAVKDTEVNTVVAMKGTQELLDANSSLTLVDEQVVRRFTDSDLLRRQKKRMPVLFKGTELENENNLDKSFLGRIIPEVIPDSESPKQSATLQRSPPRTSPMKQARQAPKSPSKSPRSATIKVPKCNISLKSNPLNASNTTSPRKSHEDGAVRRNRKRHHAPVTIQQLMTQYGAPGDMKTTKKELLIAIQDNMSFSSSGSDGNHDKQSMAKSMEIVTSFTNSNRSSMKYSESLDSKRLHSSSTRKSLASRSDWLPELVNEMSSKNLLSECESGVNVVAQIDMLPFMGSRECEWEPSGSDTWSFRMLRGRLRLTLRLAHRLDNSPRRRVRADTPVKAVCLEPTHHEKRDTIASLCVRYAAEAMLVNVARGCARAGAAPGLLRRCAAIARVALRWGAAMHEARQRLAFTVQDNIVALKVANIPLRSVWEVTLRIDMAAAGAPDAPWPAATDVRVAPVVSDCDITPEDVERALAGIKRDWGHVPKTIWKIFRFLKTKTRDDDVLNCIH